MFRESGKEPSGLCVHDHCPIWNCAWLLEKFGDGRAGPISKQVDKQNCVSKEPFPGEIKNVTVVNNDIHVPQFFFL